MPLFPVETKPKRRLIPLDEPQDRLKPPENRQEGPLTPGLAPTPIKPPQTVRRLVPLDAPQQPTRRLVSLDDGTGNAPNFMQRLAARTADLTRRAVPPVPTQVPSVSDTIRAAAAPFQVEPVIKSPTAQRVAGDVGAGLAGTAAGMAGLVPLVASSIPRRGESSVTDAVARGAEAVSRKLTEVAASLAPEEDR